MMVSVIAHKRLKESAGLFILTLGKDVSNRNLNFLEDCVRDLGHQFGLLSQGLLGGFSTLPNQIPS